jgi:hypothetical protein
MKFTSLKISCTIHLRRAYIFKSTVFLVFFFAVLFMFESILLLQYKEKIQ